MDEKAKKAAEYRKKYEQNRVMKAVSFHKEKDADLLELIENVDFSQWIKNILRERFKK
ncbi:hypothetical protein [Bergeriella denitrificans]|uniref:Putative phage associated protein n=1 Tax=Bergeriella denitrificans TaxID=494 RepID=A0A378UG47_BERDE|nr:hypothetical protein [Bergeriella denitrificans]STZ76354.1 putative phage associated protein [Bergeriella denitrificans]